MAQEMVILVVILSKPLKWTATLLLNPGSISYLIQLGKFLKNFKTWRTRHYDVGTSTSLKDLLESVSLFSQETKFCQVRYV